MQQPAIPLRRSTPHLAARVVSLLVIGNLLRACSHTLRAFLIQQTRNRRRPALAGQTTHRHHPIQRVDVHFKTVTQPKRPTALGALAIQSHLAAFNGLLRQGPRLEKARRPKPLVYANACRGLRLKFLLHGQIIARNIAQIEHETRVRFIVFASIMGSDTIFSCAEWSRTSCNGCRMCTNHACRSRRRTG